MTGLVWLASYPKSGNTWVRLLVAAWRAGDEGDLDLDDLAGSRHAAARDLFDHALGLESSELSPEECAQLRPELYRELASQGSSPLFLKVHDRFHLAPDGSFLFPPEVTLKAVYVARDPRAVAPSFAAHFSLDLDEAIRRMADPGHAMSRTGDGLGRQLTQPVGTWSQHVTSWLDQSELPVHLVRYEDLHRAPEETFSGILRACDLPVEPERVARAVQMARFDRVQAQEARAGFKERLPGATSFFRQGKTEGWRKELTAAQVARIEADHGAVMTRLGYSLETSPVVGRDDGGDPS